MSTLVIDNYDSFTFNLVQYLGELGLEPIVMRNDRSSLEQIASLHPERIVLSPGPGDPSDPARFGVGRDVVLHLGMTTPILGVCLGHQGLAASLGARIVRVPPMHGKTSPIHHDGSALFAGLASPFQAMRYHSLAVDPASLPPSLEVTARTADGIIMALRHRAWPVFGVQFHPESIGTPDGRRLIRNFAAVERGA